MSFVRMALPALGLVVLGTASACADDVEEKEPRDGVVAASETTKSELGVVEWHMAPGGTHDFFAVTGVDARGEPVAGVAISVQRFSERVGTFTYDINGADTAHLHFNYNGDHVETNIDELKAAPRAQTLLTRIQADLGALRRMKR